MTLNLSKKKKQRYIQSTDYEIRVMIDSFVIYRKKTESFKLRCKRQSKNVTSLANLKIHSYSYRVKNNRKTFNYH